MKPLRGWKANAVVLGYLLATVLVAIMLVPPLADSVGNKNTHTNSSARSTTFYRSSFDAET
jgi:hypothetical protein